MQRYHIQVFAMGALGLLLSACNSKKFDAPMQLGGQWISSATLNLGYDVYQNNCMQCHGQNGDGLGPAAQGQVPPPRNFRQGSFKFQSTPQGELPTDADLKHTIRFGLRGTGMLPWDISDERLHAVVQYIKTFSPVWQSAKPGTPVELDADPFGIERASEAIALGQKVYHGVAQCFACHPSYAPLREISAWSKELTGNEVASIRENPHLSILQDSSYNHKFMPPDFTSNYLKTGGEVARTAQLLGVGVNGTSMPAWKGLLAADPKESDRRQWALAYYINSLYKLKFDDNARKAFKDELTAKSN